MHPQLIILAAVFLCVAGLIGGVALVLASKSTSSLEDRLQALTLPRGPKAKRAEPEASALLSGPLDESISLAESLGSRLGNLRTLLEQADVRLRPGQFLLLTLALGGGGFLAGMVAGLPAWAAPATGLLLASFPLLYLLLRRKRRMSAFARQLPDALELVGRALRAGHSLAAGINLVGSEMADPISTEFTRCYEEQNLGIPLEESLEAMTERVPNLDLRFFATTVILQRQTGGDLAEILDKIGSLIRERFKIWGQIQALTGEGRLSGVVLLALPPVLFLAMYHLNPEYIQLLFSDPIGQWMLGVALLLQLVGALVIRKIINIKV